MKTKIFNNLLLKILSVIAAVLLWLVVVNIDDAVTSKPFKNIKVNMINMDVLTEQGQMCRVEEGTDTVDIVVYARRSVLSKMRTSDFVATADMQKNLRYDSMVKIDVTYTGNDSYDRIEQNRTNVLVSIEESVTEQFKVSVKTEGKPNDGLVEGSKVPEQTLVEITGPKSVVERIKRVEAKVNITGITGTVVRPCRLELLDGDGRTIDGTYLDYIGKDKDFEVTVTTLNKKLVGISFDISSAAPEGYGVSAISYAPETVTIAGERSEIAPIFNLDIPASALNPEGLTGRVEQIVDISQYLKDEIVIPDEDEHEIVVTMDIMPYETGNYIFLNGQIEYQNIQEGLSLEMSDIGALEVPVSGMPSALAGLTAEDITVSVDLSEYRRAGTYTVPVNVAVPENCRVQEGLKMTIRLNETEDGEEE